MKEFMAKYKLSTCWITNQRGVVLERNVRELRWVETFRENVRIAFKSEWMTN